jgi:hypothetical protein
MSKLRKMLYKMVEESINELNTSAEVGYFNTPKAFKKRPLNEIRINTPRSKINVVRDPDFFVLSKDKNPNLKLPHDYFIQVDYTHHQKGNDYLKPGETEINFNNDDSKNMATYLHTTLKNNGIPHKISTDIYGSPEDIVYTITINNKNIRILENEHSIEEQSLNEISYRKYNQTINNTTPKHKIRKSLRELRKYVKEINTLIDFNNRLKLEMGENNTHHWDSIKEQLDELSKELLQIGKKIKTLHR